MTPAQAHTLTRANRRADRWKREAHRWRADYATAIRLCDDIAEHRDRLLRENAEMRAELGR